MLELGAGTGLVGVVAAKLLEACRREYSMKLTDWQPIILDNLRHNLALNNLDSRTTVGKLDWSIYLGQNHGRPTPEHRFDIILGADLVYDLSHIALLHATVASLLAWPTPATRPAFHLALPARSTHSKETEAFDSAFPRQEATTKESGGIQDEYGKEWRLVSRRRREMVGEDGFQNKASRYIVYEIVWQAVEDIAFAVSDE